MKEKTAHASHKLVTFQNGSVGCQYCGKLAISRQITKPCLCPGDIHTLVVDVEGAALKFNP